MTRRMPDDAAGRGFVSRDPRVLILITLATLILTFLIDTVAGLVLVLGYLIALFATTGASWRGHARAAGYVGVFVVVIVAINAFLVPGRSILGLPFSTEGVVRGVYYSLRVVVLYATVWLFSAASSRAAVATGVAGLVRPFSRPWSRRLGLHGFLIVGFLPLFRDEVKRVRTAQRFRGADIEGGLMRRVAGARALIVPLVVSAIHRSGQLAMAVQLRDIESTIGRLLVARRPGLRDAAFAGVTAVVLAVALNI